MQPRKNASPRRLVGAQLALFRRLAGLTQRELGDRLNVGEETIASIEQGRRPLKGDLAERLDLELGTRGVLAVSVEYMPESEKYPVWGAEFVDNERDCFTHYSYDVLVVPSLLQTENYARAVFRTRLPMYSEQEIAELVAARIERQAILRREVPLTAHFIVSQAALMDRLGGDEVYAEQLRQLRVCAGLPGVSLQIMPFGQTTHAGLSGPFVLLETQDHQLLAYTDTHRGSQFISAPDDVSRLAMKYAMLRTQALNTEETKGLLDQLLGER
ncbi:helix-turn-helix domain-containing protein [Streptomyces niger]|uniref:helix-turn-helix domain-containing protein n=1 Tax=Streptomyces niger TaxID=66373 RepID=UPI00069BCEFD|nr:helix-turn-helix transcriptional regulator [Streptomyces niger]